MNIALLDKNTVSYGDVDFSEIEALGSVSCFERLPDEDEVIRACRGAEAVLVNKTEMNEKVISSLPSLKYIGAFATGYNNIDLEACEKYGVTFCNAPAYSTHAVAQHAISLMLMQAGNTHRYAKSVSDGDWTQSDGFSYYAFPQYEVYGKAFGVFGFGEIGRATAKIAKALGMEILVHTRTIPENCPYELVEKDELFRRSDYLSLHCPLNEQTEKLVGEYALSLMKPTAVLVNTSRGGLIDEPALAAALKGGRLRAACLDVAAKEPMRADNPLLGLENCIITPHVAWAPVETRQRLVSVVAKNLEAFIKGSPINVITNRDRR